MLVRIQSRDGTKRISVQPEDTLMTLLAQITSVFSLDPSQSFSLYRSPGCKDELTQEHVNYPLSVIPIRHGDMLYMNDKEVQGRSSDVSKKTVVIKEDEVDQILRKKDGKIYREKDPQLCHHGPQGKCLNCAPLEPWDNQYLQTRDPPIKHLSFHCYLRKLTSGVDKGKFVCLESISCKVKLDCPDHSPWPAGICTKCQPSAVTLARQSYRHVDSIMFEDKSIVDRFIEGWRKSGVQRIGFLYGRYEEYDDVPLGIKAVVVAIYEPPQTCTKHSIELLEDPNSRLVDIMASHLGLRKLGWIFTDLEPEENGRVSYKRNIHTHLLTGEECIMAAEFQNAHPNACIQASDGYFGSKFVTVCVSGNEHNHIDTTGYQVSNQCMSLIRDDCFVPTLDAPELGYIKESTNEQYVPDVLYKCKGEYGIEVTKLARPLPLEYLIVELTTTTPKRPKPTLPGGRGEPFPVENRETIGEMQSFESFIHYLDQQKGNNFLCVASEFHFLYFLFTTDVVQLQEYLPQLCHAICNQDRTAADQWKSQKHWQQVEQLIMATSVPSPTSLGTPPTFPTLRSSGNGVWRCQHCTLDNPAHITNCGACGLPRY